MSSPTQLYLHFGPNVAGRDFVAGDIHGCFDAVRAAMAAVDFDPGCDRLFAVGDLVDRGPSSEEAEDWIARPWFHAVRGNHEQMAIGVAAGRHAHERYARNGGAWFLALPTRRQQALAAVFDTLPVAIEIKHPAGLIGVVHADVPGGNWPGFTAGLQAPLSGKRWREIAEGALWDRTRYETLDLSGVAGAAVVFVGHSPVPTPVLLSNVAFIDTGAVFGGRLTLAEVDAWVAQAVAPGLLARSGPPTAARAAA